MNRPGTRRLRALKTRLSRFAGTICAVVAALFFASMAYANRDDAGVVFVTAFLVGGFAVSALMSALSTLNEAVADGKR